MQRGQARLSFESVTDRLQRLEAEMGELRLEVEARRSEEAESKRRGDQMRGEVATLLGRRASLEALIHEHSYSTDTVRNLCSRRTRGRARQNEGGLAPVGTLADFLEVDGKYENVVDEFLRDELNYIVVKSWEAADAGIQHAADRRGRSERRSWCTRTTRRPTLGLLEGMESEAPWAAGMRCR